MSPTGYLEPNPDTSVTVPIEYTIDGEPAQVIGKGLLRDDGERPVWNARRGWPVRLPATSPSAYVSGLDALNLPYTATDRSGGDWHEHATWWTPDYLDGEDCPFEIALWGLEGAVEAAPITPQLRDARAALATIEHPAAQAPGRVHAATMPQAVIDLAWDALAKGGEPPERRDVFAWLDDRDETEVRRIAAEVEKRIANAARRARWRAWREDALEGDDPFYDEVPGHTGAHRTPADATAVVVAVVATEADA